MRMATGRREILWGISCSVLGFVLWQFATDIDTPIITLSKVGVVLLVVGIGGVLYGSYLVATSKEHKK